MDFWINLFNETDGNTVFELACGTGRLAQVFLREGAQYTGLDIEPNFIRAAKKKLAGFGDLVSILEGDMRSFRLGKKFDLIFIGFNSLLHLLTDKDAQDFFQCVRVHMHEKSRFLIDIYMPDPLFLYRPEGFRFPVLEYTDSNIDDHVYVEESNVYDSMTGVNELVWYFSTKEKIDFDERQFSMRMYFPSKMNQMLVDAGFKVCHQWGDYYCTNLNEGSKLQIYDVQIAI